jgi:hypothetical protein
MVVVIMTSNQPQDHRVKKEKHRALPFVLSVALNHALRLSVALYSQYLSTSLLKYSNYSLKKGF